MVDSARSLPQLPNWPRWTATNIRLGKRRFDLCAISISGSRPGQEIIPSALTSAGWDEDRNPVHFVLREQPSLCLYLIPAPAARRRCFGSRTLLGGWRSHSRTVGSSVNALTTTLIPRRGLGSISRGRFGGIVNCIPVVAELNANTRWNCHHECVVHPLMRKPTHSPPGPGLFHAILRRQSTVTLLIIFLVPALRTARTETPGNLPILISKDDAIKIALASNQSLRAQRLNIDQSKAEEVTALLKPNPTFSAIVDTIPIFSPGTIRFDTQIYSEALSYTVERGGKREKRAVVAKDNTQAAAQNVTDNERTLRFQVVQAFTNVLLAKSVFELAKDDLASFSQAVDLNHARVVAGDLAEGDYLKLSLQKLQFEQDVTAAQLGLVQARATLRQQLGYQSVADDFDVTGALTHHKQQLTLDDLQKKALQNRPDLQLAHTGVKLAHDTVLLAFGNRARDWTWGTDYTYQSIGPNGIGNAIGVSFSVDLPIHDRNQGEIARSQAAVRQSVETESSTEVAVLTDVVNAFYTYQSSEQIVTLYESGYLSQATESRDISNYAYQRGAATILDVLDAERSYRTTQLAYRQALATDMIAAEQLNEAVGMQVIQ